MLSAGMLAALALSTAVRRRGFESGSPPPMRAAIVISRMSLVKSLPRLASRAPFLCLMECHLECPDIAPLLTLGLQANREDSTGLGEASRRAGTRRGCLGGDGMIAAGMRSPASRPWPLLA